MKPENQDMFDFDQLRKNMYLFANNVNTGDVGNYLASFALYQVNDIIDTDFDAIIKECLGKQAGLAATRSITSREILDDVRQALEYKGDDGSHPNRNYLSGDQSAVDIDEILDQLDSLCTSAEVLAEIRLKDWHPFYPVFWDFAFLFVLKERAIVFIGSSSD